ncbi:hypothetical protein MHYP_G00332820 [Metynnis hypsauchen]
MACERVSLLRVACSEVWVISYRGYSSTRWDLSPSGSDTSCSSTTPSKPASSHHYIPAQPPRGAFTPRFNSACTAGTQRHPARGSGNTPYAGSLYPLVWS